jgi:hypothetical protein
MSNEEVYTFALFSAGVLSLVVPVVFGLVWLKASYKWREQPLRIIFWAFICTSVFLGIWLFLQYLLFLADSYDVSRIESGYRWVYKYSEVQAELGQKLLEFTGVPVISALFLLALTFKIDKSFAVYRELLTKHTEKLSVLESQIDVAFDDLYSYLDKPASEGRSLVWDKQLEIKRLRNLSLRTRLAIQKLEL